MKKNVMMMNKKIVVADHSGSNTEFLGVFTKDSIDKVFDFLKWGVDAGTVTCNLYRMGDRGLRISKDKDKDRPLQKASDVTGIKTAIMKDHVDEVKCTVTTVTELGVGITIPETTRIDMSGGSRGRLKVSFNGSHGGLYKIKKDAEFGLASELDESSGDLTQHFVLWANGEPEKYSSGLKNRIKTLFNPKKVL